jgi:hypothetical protein
MWNPLDLLKPVTNIFTSWNDGRVELKKADLDIKKAAKENKARLLRDKEGNNHQWEMANLEDKDKWLRRFSFGMFSAPFLWALYDAEAVKIYFEQALAAMPEWYIQLYAYMIGGIWAVSELKNSGPALVGGIINAFKSK